MIYGCAAISFIPLQIFTTIPPENNTFKNVVSIQQGKENVKHLQRYWKL